MPVIDIVLDLPDRRPRILLDLDDSHSNERTVAGWIRGGRFYEPDVSLALTRLVREGDCAVDIGANAGFFTILLGALTGPGGRVLSVEPGAGNLERLRNNIALNGFGHVTVLDRPVSDAEGPVSFFINSDDSGGNALWDPGHFPANERSRATPVAHSLQATTLDKAVAEAGLPVPRLIKIDTEGAEQRILEGAGALLRDRRVPYVVAELHEFGLEQMGGSQAGLRGLMEEFGYATFLLNHDGSLPKLIPAGTAIRAGHFPNLLFSTPDDVAAGWPEEQARVLLP